MKQQSTTAALAAIDQAHAEDPAGRELEYARRMTAWLQRLSDQPDPLLELAVRAQHLKRWECPRSEFPSGRQGYLQWRHRASAHHADTVAGILRNCSFDESSISRVCDLIQKKRLAEDSHAQILEDCACLTFLETDLIEFSRKHPSEKVTEILRKTWLKMSPAARSLAAAFVEEPPGNETS